MTRARSKRGMQRRAFAMPIVIVLALVVTREGFPLAHFTLAGNTQDLQTVERIVLAVLGLASLPITLLQNGPMLYQTFLYDSASGGRGLVLGVLYTVTLAARLLILPWVLVLVTLLYFDLRLRHGERALP